MLRVAIASENSDSDGKIWESLFERLLGVSVEPWTLKAPFAFAGFGTVYRLAPIFFKKAEAAGVRHALLAVDQEALDRLRQRPSFQRFETSIRAWVGTVPRAS